MIAISICLSCKTREENITIWFISISKLVIYKVASTTPKMTTDLNKKEKERKSQVINQSSFLNSEMTGKMFSKDS